MQRTAHLKKDSCVLLGLATQIIDDYSKNKGQEPDGSGLKDGEGRSGNGLHIWL